MHRFFVTPEAIVREQVTLDAAAAHQLYHVLRLRPGAHVVVLDNSGWEHEIELTTLDRDSASGRICERRPAGAEPRLSLTLYQSVLKGDRFEWILQKGTELGVTAFVPVVSARTVPADALRIEKKRPRWERIIREAAEQSHRGRLPSLGLPHPFAQACAAAVQDSDLALLPWEEATGVSLSHVLASRDPLPERVALLVGPEGGFAPQEADLARQRGIEIVTLGPRILRAETAALVAATVVLSALGEMGR